MVDYLYTGHIHIESDIVLFKDIAKVDIWGEANPINHIKDTDDEKAKSTAIDKEVASMKVARTGARVVDLDGLIYVIGGEVYDPEGGLPGSTGGK